MGSLSPAHTTHNTMLHIVSRFLLPILTTSQWSLFPFPTPPQYTLPTSPKYSLPSNLLLQSPISSPLPRPVYYHTGVHPEPWSLGPLLEKIFTFTCPELETTSSKLLEGERAFPHPRDCSKYYVCDENGTAEEYDCLFKYTGLLFSAATGSCDWASKVYCFGLEEELAGDIEAVEEEEEIEYDCLWEGDFEDPNYCMRYFHCDSKLKVSLKYCSTGNFFYATDYEGNGACQWAASVYCGDRSEIPPIDGGL